MGALWYVQEIWLKLRKSACSCQNSSRGNLCHPLPHRLLLLGFAKGRAIKWLNIYIQMHKCSRLWAQFDQLACLLEFHVEEASSELYGCLRRALCALGECGWNTCIPLMHQCHLLLRELSSPGLCPPKPWGKESLINPIELSEREYYVSDSLTSWQIEFSKGLSSIRPWLSQGEMHLRESSQVTSQVTLLGRWLWQGKVFKTLTLIHRSPCL